MMRFDFYPGDFMRDTNELEASEVGIYVRLLADYYSTERPIPDARRFKIAQCESDDDRKKTQWVLARFFEQVTQGEEVVWIHHRVEREIAKARPKIEASRSNGKLGGRPRKGDTGETQQETYRVSQQGTQQQTHAGEGEGEGAGVLDQGGVGGSPAGVSGATPPSLPPASSPADPPVAQRSRARIAKPKPARWRRVPADWNPNDGHAELARQLQVAIATELPKFRDYEFRDPKSDADAAFRTWLRNASEFGSRGRQQARPQSAVSVALARVAENQAAELARNSEPSIFDDWEHVLG